MAYGLLMATNFDDLERTSKGHRNWYQLTLDSPTIA